MSSFQKKKKNHKAFKETGIYGLFKGKKQKNKTKTIETVPDIQGRSTRQRL